MYSTAKGMVVIHEDHCKGCGLCIPACPQEMLGFAAHRFNKIGYHPIEVTKQDACTGCELCAVVCPDVVFSVYRRRKVTKDPLETRAAA